jgi:uncharacterized protein YbjT (DUF2867 family)
MSTDQTQQQPILVASATATTGSATVKALSAMGVPVRAVVRNAVDDPRALELEALPGVTLMQGDFDDEESVAAMLNGISRCLLVSGAFSYAQFERETLFIEAAARANLEVVLRVSTASFLIKPGTKGAYGRAHHGIEAFCKVGGYPVIHLNPNWFLTNWMGNAAEAKANGTISIPCSGNGPRDFHFIDPRDIGEAAATILTLNSEDLQPILDKKNLEIHGPAPANFADAADELGKAMGYPIRVQQITREAFISALVGFGLPRVFASSFAETVEQVDGIVPPGYEGYGPDGGRSKWEVSKTSPELLKVWTPKYTVEDWANSDAVKAAFWKE